MADYSKPSQLDSIWASAGDRSPAPDLNKIATGFIVEIPTLEQFNYIEHKQDSFISHVNQKGIPQWDSVTEYLADRSYAQGSNGIVYKAKLNSVGVDPVTEVGSVNWEKAFHFSYDVYTKSESDSLHLAKSSNLADLPNTSTARGNLNVYSAAETNSLYLAKSSNLADLTSTVTAFSNIKQTATETISGVLPIATDAKAVAGTDNASILTPRKLKLGFSASLGAIGYVSFPSWLLGITIQWGVTWLNDDEVNKIVHFPKPFPNAPFQVTLGTQNNGGHTDYEERGVVGWYPYNNASFYLTLPRNGGSGLNVSWMAIGY